MNLDESFPAQVHQRGVEGHAIGISRKPRFPAEIGNLAEQLQKYLLRHVFRVGRVFQHAQADAVDSLAGEAVKVLKSGRISVLRQQNGIALRQLALPTRYRLLVHLLPPFWPPANNSPRAPRHSWL